MLDWGSDGNGWYTNVFPTLKENPPLLLFGSDIEIWDPIVYRDGIREIVNHEVYDINPKYQMLPLAKTVPEICMFSNWIWRIMVKFPLHFWS